jgi:hypothetical protein
LVAAERSDNSGLISKNNLVFGVGREKTLKESDGRVEDDSAFDAGLDANLHLVIVDEIRTDPFDIGGGRAIEVVGAKDGAKAV